MRVIRYPARDCLSSSGHLVDKVINVHSVVSMMVRLTGSERNRPKLEIYQ